MQLIIFLQISEYKFERDEYCKNIPKIALPDQYYISFPGIDSELLYMIVSIKLYIGKDTDKSHYVCDALDYKIVTLWNWYDDTINQYPGYPINVYGELLIDMKPKKLEIIVYEWIR